MLSLFKRPCFGIPARCKRSEAERAALSCLALTGEDLTAQGISKEEIIKDLQAQVPWGR